MSTEEQYLDDNELRRAIRAEIEQRDKERQKNRQRKEEQRNASEMAERKRRIYREELHRYYLNRPGYRKVVGEDGEPDWVPVEEANESNLVYDEVLEDPTEARKGQKIMWSLSVVFVLVMAVILYAMLHEGKGTIQVYCNIPQAQIILDASATDNYTQMSSDNTFSATIGEVPAGEHLITVEKPGYQIDGEIVRRIELRGGKQVAVTFNLIPIADSETGQDQTVHTGQKGN